MKALVRSYLSRLRERSEALCSKPRVLTLQELQEDNNRYLYAILNTSKSFKNIVNIKSNYAQAKQEEEFVFDRDFINSVIKIFRIKPHMSHINYKIPI